MYLIAHNGSGLDSYVVSIKIPQQQTVTDLFENDAGFVRLKMVNGYADKDKKISHYVHFTYGRVLNIISLKKIGESYRLQPGLLKQETNLDKIYEDTCEDKENESYHKNDVLSTAFSYARYSKGMEESTGFGMKNCITLQSSAKKCFNSVTNENDKPIYTQKDELKRYFVRKCIKSGLCAASNQYYKSIISDEAFSMILAELNINGAVCEILDKIINMKIIIGKQ